MRKIFYLSNAYSEIYPQNSRSKFSSFFYRHNIDYIPEGEIEAACFSLTFSNKRELRETRSEPEKKSEILAVRTNITNHTISSGGYDNILCFLTVDNEQDKGKVIDVQFQNPTFFETDKNKLVKATFEIINLETGLAPDFAPASPTFIVIIIRQRPMRLHPPFQLVLNSSCPISKTHHPSNSNSEFTIQLPKRFEFARSDWVICLKTFSISGQFYHINDCFFTFNGQKYEMREGYFSNEEYTVAWMNAKMNPHIRAYLNKDNMKVTLKRDEECDDCELELGPNIAAILGFGHHQRIPKFVNNIEEAAYSMNMYALVPENFIITADLCENSILGGQQVQILKYATIPVSKEGAARTINFQHNDYVRIERRIFDSITIKILSVSGEPVKVNQDVPTLCQILFVNTNSI